VEWFVLNTEAIVEIDITAADMLKELHRELAAQHITFAMTRVKQDFYMQLKKAGLVDLIGQARLYPTLHTAIAAFHSRDGSGLKD
jgi:MFS superfamily sulfate permease-like transporter